MEITNTKLYRARKIIHSLVDDKIILRNEMNIKTSISPKRFNKNSANFWFKETGHYGYLFGYKGSIYCHVSNEYKIAKNIIFYRVPKNEH